MRIITTVSKTMAWLSNWIPAHLSVVLVICVTLMSCEQFVDGVNISCSDQSTSDEAGGSDIVLSIPADSDMCTCDFTPVAGRFTYTLIRYSISLQTDVDDGEADTEVSCPGHVSVLQTPDDRPSVSVCTESGTRGEAAGNLLISAEERVQIQLFNSNQKKVNGTVTITTATALRISCQKREINLPLCPCTPSNAIIPEAKEQDTVPMSKRLLIGFLVAILFLLAVGAFFLVRWLLKRREQKKEKPYPAYDTPHHVHESGHKSGDKSIHEPVLQPLPSAFTVVNPAFQDISADQSFIAGKGAIGPYTPEKTNNNYTRQLPALPFSPDPGLNLDLRMASPVVYSELPGSRDSGLYSTPDSFHPHYTGYEGPYALSTDTLNSMGGVRSEPSAHSTPTPRRPTPQELEAMYAKPNKLKKPSTTRVGSGSMSSCEDLRSPAVVMTPDPGVNDLRVTDHGEWSANSAGHNTSRETMETDTMETDI